MKRLKITFIALVLIVSVGAYNSMAVEEAEYIVLLKESKIELRKYEPHILAETFISGDFEEAGNKAFGKLFQYISGNNKSRQKLDMTSPVGQSQKINMTTPVSQKKENGKWAVSFMMPSSLTADTVPEPEDPDVIIRLVPEQHIAAIRYSGFWSEKNYQKNKDRLESWVDEKGFKKVGEPVWARYNPPFTPWFMRRNEILIPVQYSSETTLKQ